MASVTFPFRLLPNTVAATNILITLPGGQLISSNKRVGENRQSGEYKDHEHIYQFRT